MRDLFEPTLNVDGLWSGYTGAGMKTILPHVATAKMETPACRPVSSRRMPTG
ncbi:hypothetical protein [Pseudoxanthomonas mexicana]